MGWPPQRGGHFLGLYCSAESSTIASKYGEFYSARSKLKHFAGHPTLLSILRQYESECKWSIWWCRVRIGGFSSLQVQGLQFFLNSLDLKFFVKHAMRITNDIIVTIFYLNEIILASIDFAFSFPFFFNRIVNSIMSTEMYQTTEKDLHFQGKTIFMLYSIIIMLCNSFLLRFFDLLLFFLAQYINTKPFFL